MKIVLTGASGQLGGYLKRYCMSQGIDVLCIHHSDFSATNLAGLDFSRVEAIVHCASKTNVESCETEVVDTFLSNFLNPISLIDVAAKRGIPFVFMSSVGLYSDDADLSTENARIENKTIHHTSKYFFEELIRIKLKEYLILRTGWVFSDQRGTGKNFIERILLEAQGGDKMVSNSEQFGHPTSARFIADSAFQLLSNRDFGTYNVVQNPHLSRFEYVKLILKYAKSSTSLEPVPASHFNRSARVNQYETASSKKLEQKLGLKQTQFYEDLEATIASLLAE